MHLKLVSIFEKKPGMVNFTAFCFGIQAKNNNLLYRFTSILMQEVAELLRNNLKI